MPRTITILWVGLSSFWILSNAAVSASCVSRVAIGDQSVGISAFEDSNCKIGGVGCFSDSSCRFCQKWASPQSNHLSKCPSDIGNTQVPVFTAPPVRTSVPTTPSPITTSTASTIQPTATVDCAAIVKKSSMSGISFVTDKTCNVARPTATGCSALTSCRLCRATKNEGNQFLMSCDVLQKLKSPVVRRALLEETVNQRTLTGTLFICLGGMAVVVGILGLAHSKFCRRDPSDPKCDVDDTGLASEDKMTEDSDVKIGM